MSNSLDPDQARRFVGPDLGPNCLPRLSADVTGKQRVMGKSIIHCVGLNISFVLFLFLFRLNSPVNKKIMLRLSVTRRQFISIKCPICRQ